ncbi:MAG: hypothetical protein ACO1SX_12195, partial [Actinomycetota bacterium]
MSKTALKLAAITALGLTLAPSVARADVRIEEQATTLEAKVKRWTAIKGDKRVIVTRAEPTGHAYNAGARYGAYVEIARPDKELLWELDPQERSYREIAANDFIRILQQGIQPPRNPNDQPLRSLYRSQTTTIEVAPTGKERKIAGFSAEQVIARVVVGAQNQVSGNQFTFTFDQEIWITKDERLVKEIQGFESAYFDQFGTAASLQQAQLMAGGWNDAFITHLRAVNDRVRALQGVPLSVTTTVTEEALAQAKGDKNSARKLTVGSLEVKKITLQSIPDSEFELPVGYINSDTKVAVAPPAGEPMKVASANPVAPPAPEMPVKPAMPVAAEQPKPVMPLVAEQPKPTMPLVAEQPKPVAPPAAVKPPMVADSSPSIPIVKPGTSIVTAAPTNVVVRGANGALPQ